MFTFYFLRVYGIMTTPVAPAAVLIRPTPKKPGDTVEDYVEYFERISLANGWTDVVQAQVFPSLLEVGSKLLTNCVDGDKTLFSRMKSHLLKSSEPYRDSNMLLLMTLSKFSSETVENYRDRVVKLVELVYTKFAAANKQQLCRDFFIFGLRDPVRSAVLNSNTRKFEEAVNATIMAVSIHSKSVEYHVKDNKSHVTPSSVNIDTKKPVSKQIKCFKCGVAGHYANKCPTKYGNYAKYAKQVVNVISQDSKLVRVPMTPRLCVEVLVDGVRQHLLCDTGASVSLLPASLFVANGDPVKETIVSVTGHKVNCVGTRKCTVTFGDFSMRHLFRIADVEHGYLGADLLQNLNATVDFKSRTLSLEIEGRMLHNENIGFFKSGVGGVSDDSSIEGEIITCCDDFMQISVVNVDVGGSAVQKFPTVDDLIHSNAVLFNGETGLTTWTRHCIDTGDAKPVRGRQSRIPVAWMDGARTKMKELIDQGIVIPSHSEWSNPIVLVRKKDSSIPRVCLDFRELNRKTVVGDAFPIPRIDDLIDRLHGKRVFSKLDLKNAYHVVPLGEKSRRKTAFSFDGQQWEFTRMPMGLVTASHTFARLVQKVIEPLSNTVGYFDDLLVASTSMEEHRQDLQNIFSRLQEAGLKLNKGKCIWAVQSVSFLGYEISENTVRPDPKKAEAIASFPRPNDTKELRRFLGMVSYYREHMPKLSVMAAPLYRLTKKNATFVWNVQCDGAFNKLKERLVNPPVRCIPDPSKSFVVITDACSDGVGGVLQQVNDHSVSVVIEYASKKFDNTQRKWSTIEKEAYAIVWVIKKWRHYLLGKKFLLKTDHKPLCWLRSKKDLNNKLGRWCLDLQQYQFDIEHVKGEDNVVADALSRREVAIISEGNWKIEVDNDIEIQKQEQHNPENFVRKSETLFKKTKHGEVLVVPKSERDKILVELHDTKSSGHLGRRKVLEKAQERFFWPGMTKDIKEYMRNCHICATAKDNRVSIAPLKPVDVSTFHPYQRIALDIMGPIQPVSKQGNRFIIVCQDYFTKWVEVKACPSTEASVIRDFLTDEVFSRYGVCDELVTDQGTQMTSRQFQEFLNEIGIRHLKTSVYHPQSDMVERTNRTFLNMIRSYMNEAMDNWDEHLQSLAFAYRTALHEGIGVSPFEAIHGWKARLPVDVYYANMTNCEKVSKSELFNRMVSIRKQIRKVAIVQSRKRAENYDKSKKVKPPRQMKEGDLIYWRRPISKKGVSPKLQKRWTGPLRVSQRLSDVNYRISDAQGNMVVVHINNIKRHYGHKNITVSIRKRGRPTKKKNS